MYTRKLKDIFQHWLFRALRRKSQRLLKPRGQLTFEGPFDSWEAAEGRSRGYVEAHILDKVLSAALSVKRGEAVFERDSVLFNERQYTWPVIAALMWSATRNAGKLSVLDFGGSLGSSYFQNREFLAGLTAIRWSVIEQAHFVSAGKQYIEDDYLRFYETIDQCMKTETPDVILLSSVLQYLKRPYEILESLSSTKATLLVIDRSPFWSENKGSLVIQHVPAQIYPASYPMHIFSEPEFLARMQNNWSLHAEFLSPEGRIHSPAGMFAFKGFLFTRDHQ